MARGPRQNFWQDPSRVPVYRAAVQLGKDNLPIGQIADITGLKNEEVKKILKDRGIKIDE